MPTKRIQRWQADPVQFARQVLGQRPWHGQRKIMRSVRQNKRTCVRSGFGTGKTHTAAAVVLWFLSCFRNSRVITTATTFHQVKKLLWVEIEKQHRQAQLPLGGKVHTTHLEIERGWEAYGLSVNDPNAFQGSHHVYQLVVFDEGQGIDLPIYDAAESLMVGGNTRWLVIGNPLEAAGPFHALFTDRDWHNLHLDGLDHPNVVTGREIIPGAITRSWVDARRRKWGGDRCEDHPMWQARVRGRFPESGIRAVVPLGLLQRAAQLEDLGPACQEDGRHAGIDLAREGDDACVASLLDGRKLIDQYSWSGMDLMASVGEILGLMQRWHLAAEHVHLDIIGLGAGVVDRLRELGHAVDGVDFGGGQADDWVELHPDMVFKNRRAELFWTARELLRTGGLQIGEEWEDTWADLTAPTYKYPQGKLLVSPKEDVKVMLGRSPDAGDSLLLALSRASTGGFGITWFGRAS